MNNARFFLRGLRIAAAIITMVAQIIVACIS